MTTISFRKACDCKYATASTGRVTHTAVRKEHYMKLTVTFNPAPSCDKCGKSWQEITPKK